MKTLVIGIASYDEIKTRTIAIARGKLKPGKKDPKIWFSSIESMAQVLSSKNKLLLEIIAQQEPKNMTELAELSGRQKSNLSRTLKTMEHYGLVELKHGEGKDIIPIVPYNKLKVDFDISPYNYL